MAPSCLPFFDPSKIEHTTAFVLRSMAHTMLGTVILLYMCTLFQPLYSLFSCLHCTVQLPGESMAPAEGFPYVQKPPVIADQSGYIGNIVTNHKTAFFVFSQ